MTARIDRRVGESLEVNGVPFTDEAGWIDVPLSNELHAELRAGDLSARVFARPDRDESLALYVGEIRFKSTTYRSLHDFALRCGAGWARYIPLMVMRCFETHLSLFAPPVRTSSGERRALRVDGDGLEVTARRATALKG